VRDKALRPFVGARAALLKRKVPYKPIRHLLAIVITGALSVAACSRSPPAVRDGDVIFQTSRSSQSVAIQRATHSPYSHMGIIFVRAGKPYVLEASATVRYTPLSEWIARGKDSSYVLKRLRTPLTEPQVEKLRRVARSFEGRAYDQTFEWSDTKIYCSELVWKIYDRGLSIKLGELQKLREFDLSDTAVRTKMKQRYGESVPLDSPVISPPSMFTAEALRDVGN
jgi:hypothetical protein